MKWSLYILLILVVIGISAYNQFPQISSWLDDIMGNTFEKKLADYTSMFNKYREIHEKQPLLFTEELNAKALKRLTELKYSYSHLSIGEYNKNLGENIINNTRNNKTALDYWSQSSEHNKNLLNPNYRYTGYAIGDGYAVQLFK